MHDVEPPEVSSPPVPPTDTTGHRPSDVAGRVSRPTPASRSALERLSRAGSHPILQSFPHGAIIVFDHDLRYLSAGGMGLPEVGLSPEMLQGRTIFEVFPVAVTALIAPLYRAALAGTESAIDVPFSGRIFLQRLGPLRDAEGAIVAGMGFTQDVTESRRLKESYRESAERLRQIIEYAPTGLAILSPDLDVIQVNPAFCRITGYGEEQLLEMNAVELADPGWHLDRVGVETLLRTEDSAYTADARLRAADGTVRWAALSVSVLRSRDGTPEHYIAQVTDISERKRAEAALLEGTRRLRDAEAVGHSGSWELDVVTERVSWSDGLFAVYGIDPESFGGNYDAAAQIIHPDDRRKVRAAVDDCVQRGTRLQLRYRLTRPNDGALRWVEARAQRVFQDGRLVRIGGSVVDITELHESENRLRQVFEHAPIGMAIIDRHQSYLQVNSAFCAITGYSEDQLLQLTVGDIADPVDVSADRAAMDRLFRGEDESYTSDTRFRDATGAVRWAARSASLLRAADGSSQMIVQINDIGDRKRSEQVVAEKTRRLREAETVGRMGSWQLDIATGTLTLSDGLLALYRIDPEAFRGDQDISAELVHPDDRPKVRAAIKACTQNGLPCHLRYRLVRPGDGELRWYEIRAERFDVDGKPDRLGGTVVDVTELALAEAEIRTAYLFQQTVMDASPDLIFAYRIDSRSVVWSNRSLAGILGFPSRQAESLEHNMMMEDFVEQAGARELDAALLTALDSVSDAIPHLNLRLQDAAGSHRWFSLRATPLHRDDLGAVTQLVGVLRDVTDAMVAEERLKYSALHDSLTGLPNRALLIDRIDGALARSGRDHREISVLFCDLDGFKHINDTAGHRAGDSVLVETARRLQAVLREGDTVARVGGDEFVILVEPWDRQSTDDDAGIVDREQTTARDRALAPRIATRIGDALGAPVVVDGVDHVVTASIGITYGTQSLLGHPRSVTADEMLQDADAAMYRAKSRGKNRFEIFDRSMRVALQERGHVEHLLREVLNAADSPVAVDSTARGHGRLSAAYQPIFDAVTSELTGFEALARLVDADGSSVAPDVFIPVAEECGLIRPLGCRILDHACSQLAVWRNTPGMAAITMAVNVSALHAADGTLGDDVHRALTAHGLEPGDIILELTETALLQAAHSTIVNLRALHEEGIGIAIDDFGIGYASLRYLATLPVSSLKIDKSFTARLPHDLVSTKIVMAVAGLAADLGLSCIVEGVETEQQRNALPPGVQLQGILTGRPQPGRDINLQELIAYGPLPI